VPDTRDTPPSGADTEDLSPHTLADPLHDYLRSSLAQARRRLLDQSRRNRLINFRELARDIPVVDELPDNVYRHLVDDGNRFTFDPLPEDRDSDIDDNDADRSEDSPTDGRVLPMPPGENLPSRFTDDRLQTPIRDRDLDRRLRSLYREHRSVIQETGANDMYLAIGFLRWFEETGARSALKSPLILLPVALDRERRAGGKTLYKLRFDDQALDTNYTLAERVHRDFQITIPPLGDEMRPEEYMDAVRAAVESRAVHGWQIEREMILGLFRFQRQVIWHDLDPFLMLRRPPIRVDGRRRHRSRTSGWCDRRSWGRRKTSRRPGCGARSIRSPSRGPRTTSLWCSTRIRPSARR